MSDKEQIQHDIADAFDFVRFILRKPQMLRKIKNGSKIHFLPAMSSRTPRPSRMSKKVQAFTAETVFHTV